MLFNDADVHNDEDDILERVIPTGAEPLYVQLEKWKSAEKESWVDADLLDKRKQFGVTLIQ